MQNGKELNFQDFSSDVGVSAKTLQNYLQIIEDTLIGFQLPSFQKTKKRKAISRAKFYLFDIGVVNSLANRGQIKEKSELFGRCFEHFLIMEIRAYLGYNNLNFPLQYWRSTTGFEVDAIVGGNLALEFKDTEQVSEKHLKGLNALKEEGLIEKFCIVSNDPVKRKIEDITIYPWSLFLSDLWSGKLLKLG